MAQKDLADTPQQQFGAFRRKSLAPALPVDQAEPSAATDVEQSMPDDLVEIGSIGEAYGVKGWVRIFAHAGPGQGSDTLLGAKTWWLENRPQGAGSADKPGVKRAVRVLQSRLHSGTVVAQLEGITDRDIAQAMRGQRVSVSRASFPALTGDEYYWVDLQGLDAFNLAGQALGVVADLIDNGVHSVLRIEFNNEVNATAAAGSRGKRVSAVGERMIPFVEAYVKSVDLAARKIVIDWDPSWDLDAAEPAASDADPES
jgi:16S rRNA processing protein RimM